MARWAMANRGHEDHGSSGRPHPNAGLEAVLRKTRRTEVCSGKASVLSGRQSHQGKSQNLVAWIAERRETEFPKPIDKAILRMVSESSGRNESERRYGLEKRKPQGPSSLP